MKKSLFHRRGAEARRDFAAEGETARRREREKERKDGCCAFSFFPSLALSLFSLPRSFPLSLFPLCGTSANPLRLCGETSLAVCLILLLCLAPGHAQEKETPTPRRKGSITGRVVAVDGQPMTQVRMFVAPAGTTREASRSFTTDDEGNFTADGLLTGAYSISAYAPAYITDFSGDPDQRPVYRLGETATITMRKGGVITGRVTNAQGDVLQDVGVTAFRVRDEAGRKVAESETSSEATDDRGIYRLFGLQPGAYLIAVSGGEAAFRFGGPASPYDEFVPIYYPSTARAGATEVKVQAGEEVQGIDIRFRGEKGHRLSGTVVGLPSKSATSERVFSGANLRLYRVPGSGDERQTHTYERQEQKAFLFHGLADGTYELRANSVDGRDEDGDVYVSPKRRVTIKGNDVSGVVLPMSPLASVAGQVVLEATPESQRKPECPVTTNTLEELLVTMRRDEAGNEAWEEDSFSRPPRLAPNDKGEFKVRALEAGRYYLNAQLPNEMWYIKAITLPANVPQSAIRNPQSKIPVDVGKQGLNIKAGEKLTGLTMTLAEGAASVRGRVQAAPDKPLPPRLRVYLVPAEKEAADELLRYREFTTKTDGAFTLLNLAPGKYWLLVRSVSEDEADERPAPPVAWNVTERAKLRRDAEAANNVLVLTPCQRVADHTLVFRSTVGK